MSLWLALCLTPVGIKQKGTLWIIPAAVCESKTTATVAHWGRGNKKKFKKSTNSHWPWPHRSTFLRVWTWHSSLKVHFDKVIFIMPMEEQIFFFFFFFFFKNQSGAVGGNFSLKFHHFSRLYCLLSLAVSSLSLTFTTHTCQLWSAACLKYRGFGV